MPPTHHNPLGHLSIGVRDYAASKAFYSAVLSPLGLHLVYDSEDPSKGGTAQLPSESTPPDQPAQNPTQNPAQNPPEEPEKQKKKKRRTLGFGPDPQHEIINVFELGDAAGPPGAGFHLALNAPTRAAVVEFHAMAVGFGGSDNGLPGVRRQYGEDYFAAFVVDPDGWRLEAVCFDRDEEEEEDK